MAVVDRGGDGFFGSSPLVKKKEKIVNDSKEDFFSDFCSKFHPLLKYEAINRHFNLRRVLREQNIEVPQYNFFCPFHDDESTGKPSARYHENSDSIYCYSEQKHYTSYHALKLICGFDMEKVFVYAWENLSDADKEELQRKYDDTVSIGKKAETSTFTDPVFEEGNKMFLVKFKEGRIDFSVYKSRLFKIFKRMYDNTLDNKGIERR